MDDRHLLFNDAIVKTVLWVNQLFKGKLVFCGSLGLVLNGKLHRAPHDIDVLTDRDFYGVNPSKWVPKKYWDDCPKGEQYYNSNSSKFYVNGILVKCFKLTSPTGINVDVMFRPDETKFEVHKFRGKNIRVQNPEEALKVKRDYLKLQGRNPNIESAKKHSKDLNPYLDAQDDLPF